MRRSRATAIAALAASAVLLLAAGAMGAISNLVPLEVGARATAMGGTYVVLADDASSTVWNPAGLASVKATDVFFAPAKFVDSKATQDFGAAAAPTSHGNFGVSYADTDLDKFVGIGYNERVYTIAYGNQLLRNVSAGVSLSRLVVDSMLGAEGWSTAFGFKFTPQNNMRYALRIKDVSSRLKWDDGRLDSFQSTFDAGIERDFYNVPKWGKITTAVAYTDLGVAKWRDGFRMGVEGSPYKDVTVRSGLAYGHMTGGLGLKIGDGSIDAAWGYEPVLEKSFILSGSLAF